MVVKTSCESVRHCVSSVVLNIVIGTLFAVKMPCSSLVNIAERGRSRQCSNSNETSLPRASWHTTDALCTRPSHLISTCLMTPSLCQIHLSLRHLHTIHIHRSYCHAHLYRLCLCFFSFSSPSSPLPASCCNHVDVLPPKLLSKECTRKPHASLNHILRQATRTTQATRFCQHYDIYFHFV